jgi:predicted RNA-binding Zn ribbon-like protein
MTVSKTIAPDNLDLVIDYVNTLDVEQGSDALSTPGELSDWLLARGLLQDGAKLQDSDLRAAVDLREALRATMLAHNGGVRERQADLQLETVAGRSELGVHFEEGGSTRMAPRAAGFDGALGALLVPVADAIAAGSWERAKACRAPDCLWAFYDRSRNRSGTWCDMAVCGNRTKVRAYRERGPANRSQAS